MAVGRVTRAHGVKGEVAVVPLTEVATRYERGSRLLLDGRDERWVTVSSARRHHGRLLVSFDEVSDRVTAEALRGRYLLVPAASSPALPGDAYWPHQIVGCDVLDESGRSLGLIREVMRGPANDVWVADGTNREILIPAVREVVVSVDVAARRIVVRGYPDLTEA